MDVMCEVGYNIYRKRVIILTRFDTLILNSNS